MQEDQNTKNEQKNVKALSTWDLSVIKFKKNRLAQFGLFIIVVMYLLALFAEFVAPYSLNQYHDEYPLAPPQLPKFVDSSGKFHLRPFVYGLKSEVDWKTMRKTYTFNKDEIYPIYFFVQGSEYKLLKLIPLDIHLFGVEKPGEIFVFGTDKNSHDLFSRIFYGSRVSLSVGLLGVFLSLIFGTLLGIASGYIGGLFDNLIQRVIEILLSFPRIPLWMALASILPPEWSPIKVYFGITIVLSIVNWGGLARQVRGKTLSMRGQEFVLASKAVGASNFYIIVRHLFPNILSHIIVVATLSIPSTILGETALSFLGLGIRPPMTSWGVLLEEAQHVRVLVQTPWLVIPVFFVIVIVLGFNFFGDGIRDAADPFT